MLTVAVCSDTKGLLNIRAIVLKKKKVAGKYSEKKVRISKIKVANLREKKKIK